MQIGIKSSEFHHRQNLYFSSQRLLEHLSVQPCVHSNRDNRKVKALPSGQNMGGVFFSIFVGKKKNEGTEPKPDSTHDPATAN